jgi:hypothetical protein
LYIVLFIFGSLHILRSLGILNMAPLLKNTKWKYLQWSENNTKLLAKKQYKVGAHKIIQN